jgi:hypothetical protein
MSFLNPAILWGLATVSIPIIIHIFNLRKTKKIEFSTLMFLKEIQQTQYKKIKLKQLLILLCRIGFVASLVIAFARPFASGYLGIAGELPHSSILFILDDSFSMQERETKGSGFDEAKNKLIEMLSIPGSNDEIYFSPVSQIGLPSVQRIYKDPDELKGIVLNTKISDITKDLNQVLFYANRMLENSTNPYNEIFFFTDGQKSTMTPANPDVNIFKGKGITKFNLVLTSERTGHNVSLDTVNVLTKIFEKNKSVRVRCTVNNHNNFNVSNKSVILNYTGSRNYRDEKAIDIPANSSIESEFTFTPDVTGYSGGYVELSDNVLADDEILNDNKRYFSFRIPDRVKVLFVSPSPTDLDYVKLALNSSEELIKDTLRSAPGFFDVIQDGTDGLLKENLKDFECIIISGKQTFTQPETDKLYAYLQEGGGVIIYPGDNISRDNYNQVLMKTLNLPFIGSTFGDQSGTQTFRFSSIDYQHPIFDGIFKTSSPDEQSIEKNSPVIKSGIDLLSGANSLPLIKLNNEKNFLVEYNSGQGKLLFYAVSPDMKESNFPAAELFAPITVRSVLYLSNRNQPKEAVTGRDYYLDVENLGTKAPMDTMTVFSNAGVINPPLVPGISLINLRDYLAQTSNYKIVQDGKLLTEFPANFDNRESVLDKYSPEELKKLFRETYKTDANVFPSGEKLSESVISARSGREIWRYFTVLALIFLSIEYFLSRSLMKQKKETSQPDKK